MFPNSLKLRTLRLVHPPVASRPKQPTARSKWAGRLLRATVSVAALAWILSQAEWATISDTFSSLNVELCLGAVFIHCTAQAVSSIRWRLLAQPLGFDAPYLRFVQLYFVGMFFNLFLPTSIGGDVVRAWYLRERKGQGWAAVLSVFCERFCGLLALLFIASAATLLIPTAPPVWVLAIIWGMTAGALGAVAILPIVGSRSNRLKTATEGLRQFYRRPRRWFVAFLISLVVQGTGAVQIGLLGAAMGLPVPWLAYAVVVPVITLLTMLPISMNGLGVREGGLALLLSPYGIGAAQALSLGLLWTCMLAVVGMLGGAVYLLGNFSRVRLPEEGEAEDDVPVDCDSDQGRERESAVAA